MTKSDISVPQRNIAKQNCFLAEVQANCNQQKLYPPPPPTDL